MLGHTSLYGITSSQSLMRELKISHVGLDSRYMSKCINITIKIYTE